MEWLRNHWSQLRQIFGEPDGMKKERLLVTKTSVLPFEDNRFGKVDVMVHGRRKHPYLDPENGSVDHLTISIFPQKTIRGISMGNWFFVPQDSFKFQLQIVRDQDEIDEQETYEPQLIDLDKNVIWREGIRGRDPRLGNPDA